ncbi:MAG: YcaO-like family protein [Spirochaetales bacterium]|nr:YcaO-like family protein [Spirochaetales bacterium]
MNRPYKYDIPENTIHNIRQTLHEVNCLCFEKSWYHPFDEVHSVVLNTDKSNGQISTSGKGRSESYALASAYAEFIERIQNHLLPCDSANRSILNTIKEKSGFFYYPDEVFISEKEFDRLPAAVLNDIKHYYKDNVNFSELYFERLQRNGYPGCLAVPWYDVSNDSIVHIPFNIMLAINGSNGMAAGNILEEALFQGLCEIIERYTAYKVYYEELTPPTVPKDFIKQFTDEYALILEIEEETGCAVIVKDFSLGKNYPSVGVILLDEKEKKYRLNIGSDTSFPVALSRGITELYQGIGDTEQLQRFLFDIPSDNHPFFSNNDKEALQSRFLNFLKFITNEGGIYPSSLFKDTASYDFSHTTFKSRSNYVEENHYLIDLLKNDNHDVYVRNVSYLGFPSLTVYVPYLSPIGKKTSSYEKTDISRIIKLDEVEDIFFHFVKNSGNRDLKKVAALADLLTPDKDEEMKNYLKLDFTESFYWHSIPKSFFLTLFRVILDNYEKARNSMELFMKTTNNQDDEYYSIILDYLKLKTTGTPITEIRKSLGKKSYKEELVTEVLDIFTNKEKLFNYIDLPVCPECNNCNLAPDCLTRTRMHLAIRINKQMEKKTINQRDSFNFL